MDNHGQGTLIILTVCFNLQSIAFNIAISDILRLRSGSGNSLVKRLVLQQTPIIVYQGIFLANCGATRNFSHNCAAAANFLHDCAAA